MTTINQTPAPSHILIVDDSRTQLESLRFLLEVAGYSVSAALNGELAIQEARCRTPQLVISDILMPVMDGYDLCRAIKSDDTLKNIPVMLLTTLSSTEDIILGLNAKADYYITKPYDGSKLLARIADILSQNEQPLGDETEGHIVAGKELSVILGGKRYEVHADRPQMLSVILSTYDHAVQRNRELMSAQHELKKLNDQLQQQQIELQAANIRLQELATVDGLTGLKNHRAFQDRLKEELLRANRFNSSLSLLLLDVDHFKVFNDTFGHPAGDEVLRRVGQLLLQNARVIDFCARYGGEEFAVIMPGTNVEESMVCGERLRHAVESTGWERRAITASFGVTTLAGDNDTREAMVQRADAALYRCKQGGRNCVVHSAKP